MGREKARRDVSSPAKMSRRAMPDSQTHIASANVSGRRRAKLDKLATRPSRTVLADAALKAATELGILLQAGAEARLDRISQFSDILHRTTDGWLDERHARLTDAQTARLYLDAIEQSRGSAASSVDEFLTNIRAMVLEFDNFETSRKNEATPREMLKFALALHTLLIADAYGRLSHWKRKALL